MCVTIRNSVHRVLLLPSLKNQRELIQGPIIIHETTLKRITRAKITFKYLFCSVLFNNCHNVVVSLTTAFQNESITWCGENVQIGIIAIFAQNRTHKKLHRNVSLRN